MRMGSSTTRTLDSGLANPSWTTEKSMLVKASCTLQVYSFVCSTTQRTARSQVAICHLNSSAPNCQSPAMT